MKNAQFFLLSLAITAGTLSNAELFAQSTVILPPAGTGANSSGGSDIASLPPSTLSATQRRWERILGQPHPEIGNRHIRMSDLLIQLRRIGLPVLLDLSAMDDSLSEDEPIMLELPNQSLGSRLNHAFLQHNATLAMLEQRLVVISLDVAADQENFMTVSYDVSQLNTDLQELKELTMISVDPDGWDETNGDATIVPTIINGRNVLTLSAPYPNHVQFRKLMVGLSNLSGNTPGRLANSSAPIGSRIVEMPVSRISAIESRKKSRGVGIGGFGGGGGVF